MRKITIGAAVSAVLFAAGANAACMPPQGFVDRPPPAVAPLDQLVAHTEDVEIARPLAEVRHFSESQSLSKTVRSPSSLPHVEGNYVLTKGEFGPVGSRQLDCLSDGSTLVEQVLIRDETPGDYHFRYVVWNYTSDKARPIDYGVGDFHYSAIAGGRTHIHWTYSFQLKRDRFPGWLGSFGDFLFRIGFLDREYADMMRGTLAGMKTGAEAAR